jgi:trk system potassium uptake protein TrkA
MRFIITGGGRIGSGLAELLVKEKHDVVVIEKDEKRAEQLGESLDALVLYGDATSRKILKDAGVEKCNALAVVTNDDKTNLMICEVAKPFNVPVMVSRVNDSSNESIFSELQITATVNTTTSAVLAFKNVLESKGRRLVSVVADGNAGIYEKTVAKGSGVIGKALGEVKGGFVVVGIDRKGEYMKPDPETKIKEGDVMILCVPLAEIKNLSKIF